MALKKFAPIVVKTYPIFGYGYCYCLRLLY